MASTVNGHTRPRLVFVFDSSRLRSHLFFRYFSTHPDLTPIYHPYMPAAMFGPETYIEHLQHSEMRNQEIEELKAVAFGNDTYESVQKDFVQTVSEVEKTGKIPLANEHWYNVFPVHLMLDVLRGKTTDLGTNPTCIPDDLFAALTPIILIRHPALSVNSCQRTAITLTKIRHGDEDFQVVTTNKELRMLFDFFTSQGRQPIVVDGEDLLWRTEELSKGLCERLGIDPAGLSDKWEPTRQEELDKMNFWVRKVTQNIHESHGIERPAERPDEPSIDRAYEEWIEKFDDETARSLKRTADECLPHYEYLRKFKV